MKRRRPLRLWRWALLVFVSLLLPLVVFELTVRMLGAIIPGDYSTGTFLTTHPAYGRFHVPGFDGWVKTTEFTSRVTINSRGLRGPERPYAKPPGVHRVLVLGDSFVEAAQVADDNSLTGLLEDRLNAVGGERYEVLNAGVGGWGTGQQLLFLREEGYRYNPDLVIVVLYLGNDVYDNSWALQGRPKNPTEPYFVFDEYGAFEPMALRARKPEDTPLVVQALRQHTLLWNIFETGVLQKLEETDDEARLRANRFNLKRLRRARSRHS